VEPLVDSAPRDPHGVRYRFGCRSRSPSRQIKSLPALELSDGGRPEHPPLELGLGQVANVGYTPHETPATAQRLYLNQ
jgi:hypothetical protein